VETGAVAHVLSSRTIQLFSLPGVGCLSPSMLPAVGAELITLAGWSALEHRETESASGTADGQRRVTVALLPLPRSLLSHAALAPWAANGMAGEAIAARVRHAAAAAAGQQEGLRVLPVVGGNSAGGQVGSSGGALLLGRAPEWLCSTARFGGTRRATVAAPWQQRAASGSSCTTSASRGTQRGAAGVRCRWAGAPPPLGACCC
jgi:hypothetical protein